MLTGQFKFLNCPVHIPHDWGLDHGAWTVVRHMYPELEVPVLQLSIDHTKDAAYHYHLAKDLYELRKKGEHYLPLMYAPDLQNTHEGTSLFNHKALGGSLTMTPVRIG